MRDLMMTGQGLGMGLFSPGGARVGGVTYRRPKKAPNEPFLNEGLNDDWTRSRDGLCLVPGVPAWGVTYRRPKHVPSDPFVH